MRNRPAVLSLAVLLAFGIVACGSSSDTSSVTPSPTEALVEPKVTPPPSDIPTTFEPTPSATEAPSTPAETEKGSEYTVSKLREMPVSDYLALSATEREPLVTNMLEYALEWQDGDFGYDFIDETKSKPLYDYNPLKNASKDNTAEEIAMQHLYWSQLALSQREDMDFAGDFDSDLATKALAGGFADYHYRAAGDENTLDKSNKMFTYWSGVFAQLDTAAPHEYAHDVVSVDFTDKIATDEYTIATIEFVTEPLPETLDSTFKKGTYTYNEMSFIWNEEVNQWQQYDGVVQNQPVGWKPSK